MGGYTLAFEKWKYERERGFYEGKPFWDMVTGGLTESEACRRFDKIDVDSMWKRDRPDGVCYVARICDGEDRLYAVKLYNETIWEEEEKDR